MMIIKGEKPARGGNGRRIVTVELGRDEKLIAVNDKQHYKLGYPLEDIMQGHIIADAVPVMWCCIEQKWVD